jgi:HlyD family secretion protein
VVKLKAPMDARVVMTALPDREYEATLASVGLQPTQSSGPAAYPVRFEIADAADIRPGMTASVTILLDRRESAVYVPSDALREQFDRIYLDVLESDGEITPVEVVVGITNGIYTEIISGVYEGQRVVIGSAKADGKFRVPSLWPPTNPTSGR